MPAKYREELNPGCVVTKGRDGQLVIYTKAAFDRKGDEVDALPDTPDNRALARVFFGGAEMQEPDNAGRILIKPEHRAYADLETGEELALVGVRRGIEVWNKDRYLEIREIGEQNYLSQGA